jgi:nicotinate-nucleotide adenylyltransferase
MKTGVLGGTFNPIHNSHLYLAGQWKNQLGLDRILLIPTYTPPHKPDSALIAVEHRLAMCALAAEGIAHLEVCDYEAKRAEKSYSYRTLEHLREENPEDELFFLMGADMFLTVQNWYMPERIYAQAVLCGAAREDGELAAMEAHRPFLEERGARTELLRAEAKPLSSTQIREVVAVGGDISGMVPRAVAEYIYKHGLYL